MQREASSRITIQATGATSWRRADVKYRKNEAFVDVIETVNLLMSKDGSTLRADVDGQILMRAYLKASFDSKLQANNVVLKIPTPLSTTKVDSKVGIGKAKYAPGENVIIWK